MPLIPYPDLTKSSPEVQEMIRRLPVPANIFKMMAHAETLLKPVMKLGGSMLGKMELDAKLRELCLLHAVMLARGEYEWMQHVPIAMALGATQPQIEALAKGEDRAGCFDATEQAALVFTRELVVDGRGSETALATLRRHVSDRQVVELIMMTGFYVMLARLTETLKVENDPPMGEALVRDIEARVAARKKG